MTIRRVHKMALIALALMVIGGLIGPSRASAYRRDRIRVFGGPNATGPILWTIERAPFRHLDAWWVFEGTPSGYYRPLLTFTDENIFDGPNLYYGAILYTIDRNTVYQGSSVFGPPLFHLSHDRIFTGNSTRGFIAFTIGRTRVFAGGSTAGEILANTTEQISTFDGPLELVLAILLGTQPEPPAPPPPPEPTPIPTPPLPIPPPPPGPAF